MAATASMLFDTIRNILTGALRGTFDTRYHDNRIGCNMAGLVYLRATCLRLGAGLGALGIMLGTVVGMVLGSMILLVRWKRMSMEIKNKMPDSGTLPGAEAVKQ